MILEYDGCAMFTGTQLATSTHTHTRTLNLRTCSPQFPRLQPTVPRLQHTVPQLQPTVLNCSSEVERGSPEVAWQPTCGGGAPEKRRRWKRFDCPLPSTSMMYLLRNAIFGGAGLVQGYVSHILPHASSDSSHCTFSENAASARMSSPK